MEGDPTYPAVVLRDPRKQKIWIRLETMDLHVPRFKVAISVIFVMFLGIPQYLIFLNICYIQIIFRIFNYFGSKL